MVLLGACTEPNADPGQDDMQTPSHHAMEAGRPNIRRASSFDDTEHQTEHQNKQKEL